MVTASDELGNHLVDLFLAAHLQNQFDLNSLHRRSAKGSLVDDIHDVAVEFTQHLSKPAQRAGNIRNLYL